MTAWNGEKLNAVDRQQAMDNFSSDAVDAEFLPYLNRINALPFVATVQSCIGHLTYGEFHIPENLLPSKRTEKWGYLQLLLTLDIAERLCHLAREGGWAWLWVGGSQLWLDGASTPGVTDNKSYQLAFAWDASWWPSPAIDITETLESVCAHGSSTRGLS